MDGVIIVDKPAGCTSHDVVNRLRRLAQTRRIGHLGTLDPLATGVLPLIIGRATRLAQYFRRNDKIYEAVLRFGVTSDTYDRDGQIQSTGHSLGFSAVDLDAALASYRGTFQQTPPPVSAKKIGGVPAYKLARKNVAVELEPVEVTVYSLDLVEFSGETARIRVHCTGGTYVRSIAHDVGERLGCGAILEGLRRTASGDFTIERARTLEELAHLVEESRLDEALIPTSELLPDIPTEIVDALTAGQIRQGRDFRVSPFRARGAAKLVKAVDGEGELVAIGEIRLPNVYHPVLVL
ncbi:MAG TPA: tRNA pseudouridine(55) synthase TruB [Bryobacteraceae bacterium]|nr:tRNA pseudouridine(55) synthase TruB [Bryobacteraceae bacterium]